MSTPATIDLPGIVTCLERFLRPAAATAGDGVEIRQTPHATIVTACEGRHAATITTGVGGTLEPVLVDPAALAGGDAAQPLKLYRLTPTTGVVVPPAGELVSVTLTPGELRADARGIADVVEGEIASGSTRKVFEIDPRHLLAVAEALTSAGAELVTVALAPRWNALAITARTTAFTATFVVAGQTITAAPGAPDITDDDPLEFTIADRRAPAAGTRRHLPAPPPLEDQDLPF